MPKLLSATLRPYCHNRGGFDIVVTLDDKPNFVYKRSDISPELVRAQDGDAVTFMAYSGPTHGFGGHKFTVPFIDGHVETFSGAWSSRDGCINRDFPYDDHVAQCLTEDLNIVTHITVAALQRLGIRFRKQLRWGGEIYYIPEPQPFEHYWLVEFSFPRNLNATHVVQATSADEARNLFPEDEWVKKYAPDHHIKQIVPFVAKSWADYD